MSMQSIGPEMDSIEETMTNAPVGGQERRDRREGSCIPPSLCLSEDLRMVDPSSGDKPMPLCWSPQGRDCRDDPLRSSVPLQVDWGDALAAPTFYGCEEELAQLTQWVVQERCHVVSLLGLGGIGKSALSVNLMYRLSGHFEVVIFRSLRDAPSCEALLDDCLRVLSQGLHIPPGQARGKVTSPLPTPIEGRLNLLLSLLRKARVLIVLDNLECLLQEGNVRGHFRPGFGGYGLLLHRVIETVHQSCLLLTSREKPAELRLLEGRYSSVRSLRLTGLDAVACKLLLEEKGLAPACTPGGGISPEQARLVELYGGNPLALQIVAETIVDLFGGEIGKFLTTGTVIFGSITMLLDEQFARLSVLEKMVLCGLAIVPEPGTLDELLVLLVPPLPRRQMLLEAVDGLSRRSLIECGKRLGSFTLQAVVREYVTSVLIAEGSHEIQQDRLDRLIQYSLSQAHAKECAEQTLCTL